MIKVPYKSIIQDGLQAGKSFIIRGVANPTAHRIYFNLRHRYGIAFQFNPRFDENRVVCNTWDGKWGREEHSTPVPFVKGQPFEVTIHCALHDFNVSLHGQHVLSYAHRFKQLNEIDVFEIYGDVQLNSVEAA